MKRNRNNNRRRQGSNANRSLESTGPEVKIRGTAMQIYDKYQTLARDAQTSGDRVRAESLLQHAEHYYRLMKAQQPTPQAQTQAQGQPDAGDNASGEAAGQKSENAEEGKPARDRNQTSSEAGGQSEDRPVRKRRRRPRISENASKSDEQPESGADESDKAGSQKGESEKATTPEIAAE